MTSQERERRIARLNRVRIKIEQELARLYWERYVGDY